MYPVPEQARPAAAAVRLMPGPVALPERGGDRENSCSFFLVRRARPEDTALVHGLVQVGMLAYAETTGIPKNRYGVPDLQALKETPADTAAAIQRHLVLLGSKAGEAAGTVRLNVDRPDTALFERFAVSPVFQGQGLARLLFYEAVDICRLLGREQLVLYTAYGDFPALHLYEKLGFQILDIETDGPYPRARMSYDL